MEATGAPALRGCRHSTGDACRCTCEDRKQRQRRCPGKQDDAGDGDHGSGGKLCEHEQHDLGWPGPPCLRARKHAEDRNAGGQGDDAEASYIKYRWPTLMGEVQRGDGEDGSDCVTCEQPHRTPRSGETVFGGGTAFGRTTAGCWLLQHPPSTPGRPTTVIVQRVARSYGSEASRLNLFVRSDRASGVEMVKDPSYRNPVTILDSPRRVVLFVHEWVSGARQRLASWTMIGAAGMFRSPADAPCGARGTASAALAMRHSPS